MFGFFPIQIIAREILIYVLHRIFSFRLERKKLDKKVIKAKRREAKHAFVYKVFNYDFIKFEQ